jgi:hypothetical protein
MCPGKKEHILGALSAPSLGDDYLLRIVKETSNTSHLYILVNPICRLLLLFAFLAYFYLKHGDSALLRSFADSIPG